MEDIYNKEKNCNIKLTNLRVANCLNIFNASVGGTIALVNFGGAVKDANFISGLLGVGIVAYSSILFGIVKKEKKETKAMRETIKNEILVREREMATGGIWN